MTVEEYIDKLELHDMPVHGINFDLRHRKLIIHYSHYVEEMKDYRDETLTFIHIDKIEFNGWDSAFEVDEITSANVVKTDVGYAGRILFLSGPGGPEWRLCFNFVSIGEMK